ncbi:MAG TPA: hypothetical protein VHQ03_03035 [Candidatus Dormibacteraeota bacterium]|jgi:beta-phosphoglucomutase-like phosphatase (HAD superfamily)|nr:hypothetical protein [Candidatus Dormibacteraeota bacterium]
MAPKVVLLDLGGVLFRDPWEAILLTPERGLADQLGLDREAVARVGRELWPEYSQRPSNEADYWTAFASKLGVSLPEGLIARSEAELLTPNPFAFDILERARRQIGRIGVVSENTSFWYPIQARLLSLEQYVDQELVFLSFELQLNKDGLLNVATSRVNPALTLVVEDRPHNVEFARRHGFQVFRYESDDADRSFASLMRVIGHTTAMEDVARHSDR